MRSRSSALGPVFIQRHYGQADHPGAYDANDYLVNGTFVPKSPNGTRYRLIVTDAGALTTTAIP